MMFHLMSRLTTLSVCVTIYSIFTDDPHLELHHLCSDQPADSKQLAPPRGVKDHQILLFLGHKE